MRRLVRAVISGGASLLAGAQHVFRPLGLTAAQFNALEIISETATGVRPSEITRRMVVDASSTTYLLDQLESRGWIRRIAEPSDRRAYRVVLSAAGSEIHQEADRLYINALRDLRAALPGKLPPATVNYLEALPAAAAQISHAPRQ